MLQRTPKTPPPTQPSIAILGAGFSGMGMAIALKQCGRENFTIYEKSGGFGGTWRENTYPGVACDVPSHLYSFSFEPNPGWSKRFSPGEEIREYLDKCADKYRLHEKAQFGKKVTRISHDGRRWTLVFADGATAVADIVVSGLGGLHEPNIPDLSGLNRYKGEAFHTAQWRHDVDLQGKKVAVIGSAASAVQVIPEIAPIAAHLDVYQRTPNWIMPRMSYHYPAWASRLFSVAPFLARAYRGWYFTMLESRHRAFHKNDNFMKRFVRKQFAKHMDAQVSDPDLRARLTPDYPVGCKRILISDDYLPAIQRPNVNLITEGVEALEEGGVRTADGALHEADVLIFATGFKPFNLLDSVDVVGPGGRALADFWSEGITAHRTVAAPGFPNFFLLLGPNSGLGHNSVVLMIEAQVKYILKLIENMTDAGADLVEPTAEAAAVYDARLQRELSERVWASGCGAWYVDGRGRNFTLYPNSVRAFLAEMKKPDLSEYVFQEASVPA